MAGSVRRVEFWESWIDAGELIGWGSVCRLVQPSCHPCGVHSPLDRLTHGSATGSTVGYFLVAPPGLGFVGLFALYRAGGVSAGREARATYGGGMVAVRVGKAADPKTGDRATGVGSLVYRLMVLAR